MNIYLNKYLKYKKKYYKLKYGGEIENNSIEIFRCYLDILLYKLDIKETDWSKIRNSEEYKMVKTKYEETTKDSTKNNGFFQKMYENTPIYYMLMNILTTEEKSYATIIYDKYIRVGNENVCMPHGIQLFEVCKESDEFYKWHDPNNENKLSQLEIGKNIGKKKIPSYLKFENDKFNSLSKIKYMIERCLFNQEYTDKDKIKAIIVPLYVKALYDEEDIKSYCTEDTNHANMFLIKINRTKGEKIKLVLQYFDPNTKQALYLQKRFEKYAEKINEVSEGKYKITGVEKLDLDIKKSAIEGEKSAIHDVFPYLWVYRGICGSVTWIIFILWTKVCSVVKDFDNFYNDIIDILHIQSYQDEANIIYKSDNETKNNLSFIDSKINKKKIKECYIDFLYIIYKFLNYLSKDFKEDTEIKNLHELKFEEINSKYLQGIYIKLKSKKKSEKYIEEFYQNIIDKSIKEIKEARDKYEKILNKSLESNNIKIDEKLKELEKLK